MIPAPLAFTERLKRAANEKLLNETAWKAEEAQRRRRGAGKSGGAEGFGGAQIVIGEALGSCHRDRTVLYCTVLSAG